ncbi:MAG: DoxX family protein [Cruoricaptor ignavus]|nr:DoxX family protein [Cruoricaptor ignavus]
MNYFTSIKNNPLVTDFVLLIIRIFIGFAMITHGLPKLQKLLDGGEIQFFNFLGLGTKFSLGLTVFSEFFCSIFIILGLFSRWASFFLFFTMLVVAFVVHGGDAFSDREIGFLYMAIYLVLLAFGPGKYSVDGMISRRKEDDGW